MVRVVNDGVITTGKVKNKALMLGINRSIRLLFVQGTVGNIWGVYVVQQYIYY